MEGRVVAKRLGDGLDATSQIFPDASNFSKSREKKGSQPTATLIMDHTYVSATKGISSATTV